MSILFAALLFFSHPEPMEMPRAEAFLVTEGDRKFLEDRYVRADLWTAHALLGRWSDRDARVFSLYILDRLLPAVDADQTVTRATFEAEAVSFNRKRHDLRPLVDYLSPVDLAPEARPIRQLPHGFASVDFWNDPTNLTTIVCSFRIEKAPFPFLVTWELAEGDDFYAMLDTFEKNFLDRVLKKGGLPDEISRVFIRENTPKKCPLPQGEREFLRRDVRHNVALYPKWHCTDGDDFEVIDDLPARSFVVSLTNDLRRMRTRYAEVLPTGLDGSNALCVARLYANREEYLMSIDANMAWTAAYWSPERRELVAHLPQGGAAELLRTFRHEAFHQYLSYALSMIPASPWLNEGYAQYFEDDGAVHPTPRENPATWLEGGLDAVAEIIPGVLGMDYEQFYEGTSQVRQLKYRIAWSIAVFLEEGAPKVRFQPFKSIKSDYINALFRQRDMRKATAAAFRNEDLLKEFIWQWKKFWE